MPEPTTPALVEPACRTCEDWGSIVVIHEGDTKREYLCPQAQCEARDKRAQMDAACALPPGD